MANNVRVEDRLEGASNFFSWKTRIITILEELELEEYIEKEIPIPQDETEKLTWKRRNNKAKKIIVDSVKDHILPSISEIKSAYEVFQTIKNTFEINNSSRLITLKSQLLNTKMEKGDSIHSYFEKISETKKQLSSIGNKIEDQELSLIALRGLPMSWDTFIQVVSRPSIPTFDQLKNECIAEESRLISRGITSNQEGENQALHTVSNKRKRKFNKKKFNNNNKKKFNKDHSHVKCFKCEKIGHTFRNCPEREKILASLAETKEDENQLYYSALSSEVNSNKEAWIVDSGASRHISGFRDMFDSFGTHITEGVTIGDNSTYPVKGIGTCSIKLKDGTTLNLKDVLFVPGIKRNLISISSLTDDGYHVTFNKDKVLYWHNNSNMKNAIIIGSRFGTLYRLSNIQTQALSLETSNVNELWHRRLGHIGFSSLHNLDKITSGTPKLDSSHRGTCKGCALGKIIKKPFPSSEHKSKSVLELVHSDLCGPMPTPSLGGFLYYISFIDDFSRKTWIYFLKVKESNEVLSKFKTFRALVENQTSKRIKTLRSDNGGEYTSDIFKKNCNSVGIKREYTVPYNPQQNGVTERKNRTIIEAAKAMLHDQNMHASFWAEASKTAVYIQNRCPHSFLKNTTPEEVFSGIKPDLSHLRIFGCPVYIHIPKEKRTKLEPSGKRGIFIGYCENSKGYRIYIPGQRSVEISRDVIFEEDSALKLSTGIEDEPISDDEEIRQSENQREQTPEEREPDITNGKKRPLWARKMLEENNVEPDEISKENKRTRNQSCYTALITEINKIEPSTAEEALKSQEWKDAMVEEYNSIIQNDVWDIVPRPKDKTIVSSKWLYKIKYAADGSIEKHKARFVARGFSQKAGIDYEETFAPVARYTSVRTIIAIAASKGWKIHQMDVKTAFLNGVINEEVYIEQPEGFTIKDKKLYVCKLKKALYGLKQAPRAWYERIDNYLSKLGYSKNEADSNIYFKTTNDGMVILVLYVDDLLITGDDNLIEKCKQDLIAEFEMKDLGLLHYFLGLEVNQKKDYIFLHQGKYTQDILTRFGMMDSKPLSTPMETNLHKLKEESSKSEDIDPTLFRQIIGSLMYLVNSRPDICYATNVLSHFMCKPKKIHLMAAKHILRYLRGSIGFGLKYEKVEINLEGYTDSDWAGCSSNRKSTTGCCFSLGSAMISWFSRKQPVVALSSTEAEYVAASMGAREAVWLRKLLFGLFGKPLKPTVIHCDNQSCIKLSENPVFHNRSKHIETPYHYIRDMVGRDIIKLSYINTNEQNADIFTKPLAKLKIVYFREKLGMVLL